MTTTQQTPAAAPGALSGSVALVTAASRGIGRAVALDLARNGADVALGVRDPEGAAALALADEVRALGVRVMTVPMDVTDLAGCREAVDRVAREFGRIDVLVNNAGGGIVEDALDVTEEHFDAVWALTTKSTFFVSQSVARHMREAGGGSIVNVASQAGMVALPGESSYCISKAAVIHMTKCLAVEWGTYGIRVNAVAPTFIETEGTAAALSDDAFRADTVDRIAALHRIGEPQEVAAAVTFLAGGGASLVTGTTLPIDGGWTAR
jgi:NAD(P)-dependent dehydrogenase (short-subunit alcohol dehydrogenase family)